MRTRGESPFCERVRDFLKIIGFSGIFYECFLKTKGFLAKVYENFKEWYTP